MLQPMTQPTPFALVLATLALLAGPGAAQDAGRPNILLVVADDVGFTDIGAYGSEIETPNLDALAQQGLTFTDFHSSVSCSPTRSMLFSGNDNHVAGLGQMGELLAPNQVGQPGYEGHLNDRVASLAEILKDAGYNTYMAGKWHLGHQPGTLPHDRGFDQSFSMLIGGASHWADMKGILPADDPASYSQNGKLIDEIPADFYSSRSYADMLMDMIRSGRSDGKPFFAYLAFTAGHDPVQVPEPWLSKYAGRYDDGYEALMQARWQTARDLGLVPDTAVLAPPSPVVTPWDGLSGEEQAYAIRSMEVYAGMIEAMDYNFGRVLDFLGDIDALDNTIVLFLSDNGANPWYSNDYPGAEEPEFAAQFDNGYDNIGRPGSNVAYGPGWATASTSPLNLFKMTVGEGGIRVPFLIAGPGISKGQMTQAFAYVWDVLPTLMETTGATYPADKAQPRGRSMWPVLRGEADVLYGPEETIGGEMGGDKWMRQGSLKAVMVDAPYGNGEWKLFDLAVDPDEAHDLADERPGKLAELRQAWEAYADDVGVIPAGEVSDAGD